MFTKVLIANRGAIATRIIRTLRQMGCQSVAVYNEADVDSLHVQHADESYSLGEGRAADTYLDQDKLFAVIEQSGAQAVHPGYGFLSENAEFVKRCEQKGIAFIGPTAEQMQSFGLKHTARQLAEDNHIPLLPGTGLLDSVEQALDEGAAIGYPVMLKSTAGGGGIGMQLCWNQDELAKAYDSVRRLGENNFSNSGVFIEKFIEYARHIEVQVFGDGKGKAIALGERDCSTQRRNQKVLEESPAPNIPDEIRHELQQTAVRLVEAVNYRNAGTVEFLLDQDENFYFLEVNARLQVEHPVTELTTGIDLVKEQIRLSSGEPLAYSFEDLQKRGWAIECRINAEDPDNNFMPSPGVLKEYHPPGGFGIRLDTHLYQGYELPIFYDSLIAKLISHDLTREGAIRIMKRALEEFKIEPLKTTIPLYVKVMDDPLFQKGDFHTGFIHKFLPGDEEDEDL